MLPRVNARFIEPMLLRRTDNLPDDPGRWQYQVKFDGYRAVAFRTGGKVQLRSRNNSDFAARYPMVVRGLARLPDETAIDGELVAFDEDGRPSFTALQNAAAARVAYYVFDVMILRGRDLMGEPLDTRTALLEQEVAPTFAAPVGYPGALQAGLPDVVRAIKAQGLEGVVAKRRSSRYESGLRSGAWMKMRINQSQEFVIGGYTLGNPFDALIFGYYDDTGRLIYTGRTRSGFTPAVRAELTRKFRRLAIAGCPFANLPEAHAGRWGQGLTKEKMADCRWLAPELVGQFEFVEWTPDGHLRHSKFIALRDDKPARSVGRT